jgi:hypothetical protein
VVASALRMLSSYDEEDDLEKELQALLEGESVAAAPLKAQTEAHIKSPASVSGESSSGAALRMS